MGNGNRNSAGRSGRGTGKTFYTPEGVPYDVSALFQLPSAETCATEVRRFGDTHQNFSPANGRDRRSGTIVSGVTGTQRKEPPRILRIDDVGTRLAKINAAIATRPVHDSVPATQRSTYPSSGRPVPRVSGSPVGTPNMTPGQEPSTNVGSLIDLLGIIREYKSWLEGYANQGMGLDRRDLEKRWKSTPQKVLYNGAGDYFVTGRADVFNDPARSEYVDLPTYTSSGVKNVPHKYVGEPGKRQWTRDNVHYYDETTNPPWIARPVRDYTVW